MSDTSVDDRAQIRALIERQFGSLSWSKSRRADWDGFAADFLPDAPLYPGSRPVTRTSVPEFINRMRGLSKTSLPELDERLLGDEIYVFGNVAVALAVCELDEGEGGMSRNVEAILLVKSEGAWRIAGQAWDTETEDQQIPSHMLKAE